MEKEIKITPPEEIWKDVEGFEGFEGFYQVSNMGRVRSLDRIVKSGIRHNKTVKRRGKILKPTPHHDGYLCVCLSKDNTIKVCAVHRLVAHAFIPNDENKPHIDHINTITGDNRVENLRWVTPSENVLNPITRKRLVIANRGCNNPMYGKKQSLESRIAQSRPVLQFSKDGTFIKEFPAIFLAAEEVGAWKTNITACCKNFNKTAKGFRWKYKEMN